MTETTQVEKATRGDGPVAIWFIDSEGKKGKRAMATTVALEAVAKGAESGTMFPLSEIDLSKIALFAQGTANKIKTYATNHGKEDGSDAIALIQEIWADLKEGKVSARGTGEGKAPKVRKMVADPEMVGEAWKIAFERMAANKMTKTDAAKTPIVELTADQVADFKVKFAMAPGKAYKGDDGKMVTSQAQRLASYKGNAYFAKAFAELEAKTVKPDKANKEVADDSLPF